MGEGEVTQLKVEIAEIKTTLKAFIKEMKENHEAQEKIAELEREKILLEMNGHRSACQREIENLKLDLKNAKFISKAAVFVALLALGVRATELLNL